MPAMYECALVRLRAADMDQEVKERAIAACGQLICHFGDYLEVFCFIIIFLLIIVYFFYVYYNFNF